MVGDQELCGTHLISKIYEYKHLDLPPALTQKEEGIIFVITKTKQKSQKIVDDIYRTLYTFDIGHLQFMNVKSHVQWNFCVNYDF